MRFFTSFRMTGGEGFSVRRMRFFAALRMTNEGLIVASEGVMATVAGRADGAFLCHPESASWRTKGLTT